MASMDETYSDFSILDEKGALRRKAPRLILSGFELLIRRSMTVNLRDTSQFSWKIISACFVIWSIIKAQI